MNPEIKAQWVAALRSGDYQQGRGQLRSGNNTYCCLGVLMELAVEAGVLEGAQAEDEDGYCYHTSGENGVEFFELTPEVVEWVNGSDSGGPELSPIGGLSEPFRVMEKCDGDAQCDGHVAHQSTLIALNDAAKYDFNQIADVIEAQF